MEDISFLSDYVQKYKQDPPSGCYCKFIRLNTQLGIKCYTIKYIRDNAAEKQKLMWEHGLAPKVGISFDILSDVYCYTTEVAEPIVESDKTYRSDSYKCCNKVKEEQPTIDDDINILCVKMRDLGYKYTDIHYANFGILNGQLVCIDFS